MSSPDRTGISLVFNVILQRGLPNPEFPAIARMKVIKAPDVVGASRKLPQDRLPFYVTKTVDEYTKVWLL